MTDRQMLAVVTAVAWKALNCEGAAKAAAIHLGAFKGHDCSEFDEIRRALQYLDACGYDTEALFQQGDSF